MMTDDELQREGGIVAEVLAERERQQQLGWTVEHDDLQGEAHLIAETHYRLGHMGEVASPESVRDELVECAALLVAAIAVMDRA